MSVVTRRTFGGKEEIEFSFRSPIFGRYLFHLRPSGNASGSIEKLNGEVNTSRQQYNAHVYRVLKATIRFFLCAIVA
jgi:hypothetical protein